MLHSTCANCDAPLSGPYCAQCGQHVHDSARTLGALLHDGWHVLTHLDGRFWGTLHLLLVRPGQLTIEYFASRRARYVPPVRLYLVLSILVFALLSATSHVAAPPSAAEVTGAEGHPTSLDFGLLGISAKDCSRINSEWPWLTRALQTGCARNANKSATDVAHTLGTNLPRMMFVFLPLMALVTSCLYWFPRRYYVEHLVFFLHNHAALYLAMSIDLVCNAIADLSPSLAGYEKWGVVVLCLYAPWYVYRSMRTFYGQRRWLTLLKIGVVSFAYLMCLTITLLLTIIYSVYLA